MAGVKVKICKIADVRTARRLESLGADFVGVHVLDELTRDKELLYKRLQATLTTAKPVVVTCIKDVAVLKNLFGRLRPQFVQLHSNWTKNQITTLKETCPNSRDAKIIDAIALDAPANIGLIGELSRVCDYLLFDRSYRGGTGITIDEGVLKAAVEKARPLRIPFFIAGGLTPENVRHYVNAYRPYGVDVQSGVASSASPDRKDYAKVKKFIAQCKG